MAMKMNRYVDGTWVDAVPAGERLRTRVRHIPWRKRRVIPLHG
jgi:hypothetical protein